MGSVRFLKYLLFCIATFALLSCSNSKANYELFNPSGSGMMPQQDVDVLIGELVGGMTDSIGDSTSVSFKIGSCTYEPATATFTIVPKDVGGGSGNTRADIALEQFATTFNDTLLKKVSQEFEANADYLEIDMETSKFEISETNPKEATFILYIDRKIDAPTDETMTIPLDLNFRFTITITGTWIDGSINVYEVFKKHFESFYNKDTADKDKRPWIGDVYKLQMFDNKLQNGNFWFGHYRTLNPTNPKSCDAEVAFAEYVPDLEELLLNKPLDDAKGNPLSKYIVFDTDREDRTHTYGGGKGTKEDPSKYVKFRLTIKVKPEAEEAGLNIGTEKGPWILEWNTTKNSSSKVDDLRWHSAKSHSDQ